MPIHQSVLELIGETPIVQARNLDTGPCTLFLKLESQNPGGSVKDRIGISMIEAAGTARRHQARRHPRGRHRRATPASALRSWRSRRATSSSSSCRTR
jgi:hypothetical protein